MGEFGVTPFWDMARQHCRIRNKYVKEFIGELLGTAILCHYMVGVGIQHYAKPGASSLELTLGGIIGIMTAVLITGGLSGAHINPAVSFGLAIAGKLSWPSLMVYWVGQFLGGYLGSGLAVSLYYWPFVDDGVAFKDFIPQEIFRPAAVYYEPTANKALLIPFGITFYDQIVCSTVLLMAVCGLLDKRNMNVPKHMLGFFFCLVVAGISLVMGANFGAYMNPARDLCPRLMALTMGYDVKDIMTPGDQQTWASGFFAPFIGALIGTVLYIVFIGAHLDDPEEEVKGDGNNNGGDWRSTRFIPKAQIPNQSIYNAEAPPSSTYGANNNNYQGSPPQSTTYGNPNANYGVRDDMRYRQGY